MIIKSDSRSIYESNSFICKKYLAPLGITAAASATDEGIQKKVRGSRTTTLINSNEEMNDIMKRVQAL